MSEKELFSAHPFPELPATILAGFNWDTWSPKTSDWAQKNLTELYFPETWRNGFIFLFPAHLLSINPYHKVFLGTTFGNSPYGLLALHYYSPKPEIAALIADFYRKELEGHRSVGLHLRFGRGREDLYFDSVDPEEVGRAALSCLDRVLLQLLPSQSTEQESTPIRIFLATDNTLIRRQFRSKYGSNLLEWQYNAAIPDQTDRTNAIFDTFLLSLTDHFIGTFGSTFSAFSAARRLAPSYYLNRQLQCHLSRVPEPFWPKPSLIEANPAYTFYSNRWGQPELVRAAVGNDAYEELRSKFGVEFDETTNLN